MGARRGAPCPAAPPVGSRGAAPKMATVIAATAATVPADKVGAFLTGPVSQSRHIPDTPARAALPQSGVREAAQLGLVPGARSLPRRMRRMATQLHDRPALDTPPPTRQALRHGAWRPSALGAGLPASAIPVRRPE